MNYVVAIPLDPKTAEAVGKKGSENSITFYNRKVGDDVIVALAPSSVEEKFYAVPETLLIADQIVLSTSMVDRLFGEMLLACALAGKRTILTADNNVDALVRDVGMRNGEYAPREELLQRILSHKPEYVEGGVRVDVDKSFPVKGVGSIALGIVTRGIVKVHDELYHSSGKRVMVRSIQSQDVDVNEAGPGTRVGLAIKGIEHDEVGKGDIFSSAAVEEKKGIKVDTRQGAFGKEDVLPGNTYGVASNFSYSLATVSAVDGNVVSLNLDKGLALQRGDSVLLTRERAPRIFAAGRIVL